MDTLRAKIISIYVTTFIFVSIFISIWIWAGGWQELSSESIFNSKFDAISALASSLAFCGLVCTILLQHVELKATRDELAKAAKANEESSELAKAQLRAGYLNTVMNHDMAKILNLSKISRENSSETTLKEIDKMIATFNDALEEYDKLTKAYRAKNAPPEHW